MLDPHVPVKMSIFTKQLLIWTGWWSGMLTTWARKSTGGLKILAFSQLISAVPEYLLITVFLPLVPAQSFTVN